MVHIASPHNHGRPLCDPVVGDFMAGLHPDATPLDAAVEYCPVCLRLKMVVDSDRERARQRMESHAAILGVTRPSSRPGP